jgi:hypothetical protein
MPEQTPAEREALGKARQAEAAATKAELELADLQSPDGVLARAAKNRQAAAEADKAAAAAQQAQLSALVPDFSKANASTLAVEGSGAVGSSGLTFGCLDDAATAIAAKVAPPDKTNWRVLVTSDADLASADTVHAEVSGGLKMLLDAATELLADTAARKTRGATTSGSTGGRRGVTGIGAGSAAFGTAGLAAGGVVGAAAAAIPQLLSVFSAQRSLTIGSVTVSDLAAAAAVASKLIANRNGAIRVMHDDFRLVPQSAINDQLTRLGERRIELTGRRLELATRQSALEEAQKGGGTAAGRSELGQVVASAALVESLLAAIDAFLSAIRTIPSGGRRTPLATASLYQAIHDEGDKGLTHVLLVKAQPAQSAMLTDDKPFMFADKFSTLVELSVTYMLVATNAPWLVASGTETAMTMAHGKLGEAITLEDRIPLGPEGGRRTPGKAPTEWTVKLLRSDRTTGDD